MKQILALILIFSLSIYTYSQNKIGIDVGISRTGIDFFGKGGFGFQVGGIYEIKISNHFLVRPNINFAFQGDRRPRPEDEASLMNRINYLILPIDLIYQIKEKYRIIGGAQYGTLLSSDFPVKANDFGIFVGFGQIIDDKFFFNIKFYNGLTNINKSNSENHINQYLNIGIGYYFN